MKEAVRSLQASWKWTEDLEMTLVLQNPAVHFHGSMFACREFNDIPTWVSLLDFYFVEL